MTSEGLKIALETMTAHKKSRLRVAVEVIENPDLVENLLEYIFEVDTDNSFKAAWVLELVCLHNLDVLAPHLKQFTSNLKLVTNDSAVRPLSKICELIAKRCDTKKESIVKDVLTKTQIEHIVEASFDWLIGPFKVAAKAFAMSTLYVFGKESTWIHEELRLILEKDMPYSSAAFQCRGKKILERIKPK